MLETPPSLSGIGMAEGTQCMHPGLAINHLQDQLPALEERGGEVLTLLSSCRTWRGFLKQMVSR